MPRNRGLGNGAHRTEADAREVLCDPDDEPGNDKTDNAAVEQVQARNRHPDGVTDVAEAAEHKVRRSPKAADREDCRNDEAAVKRAHDRVVGAKLHEIGAND